MGAKREGGRITAAELAAVKAVAGKVRRESGRRFELDELVAMGNALLVEAEREFDPSRSGSFRTFASHFVLFKLRDALRAERRPRPNEQAALAVQSTYCHVSAEGDLGARVDADESRRELRRAMAALDPEDAALLEAFYLDRQPLGDIAATLGIAYPTVLQRRARALARLQHVMGASGAAVGKILRWRSKPRTRPTGSLESTPSRPSPSSSSPGIASDSATASSASWRRAG